jgi:hypothetical protein
MPHLEDCKEVLRRLIATGDPNSIPSAERAIADYLAVTPEKAKMSGLRVIQQDVLDQRNSVVGTQHNLAQTISDYIEKKLRGE